MSTLLIVFGILLLMQCLLSLAATLRLARFALRAPTGRQRSYQPKAVVLVPCKGLDHEFEENLRPLFNQDYREYEIIFITESETDVAHAVLSRMIRQSKRACWLLVAGEADNRGQKIHNLSAGVEMIRSIDRRSEVLVFADADARPGPQWLAEMVAPLGDKRIGATTGFRWFVPPQKTTGHSSTLPAMLLAVWNASALTLLGEKSRFAWGGSMAIRRENFERLSILRRWQGAISDDYVLSAAVHEAGQRIRFVPPALVASPLHLSWSELLEFTTRQIRITRIYSPGVWKAGLATHLFFNLTFWGMLARIGWIWQSGGNVRHLSMLWAAIYLLGAASGWIRAMVATDLLNGEAGYKWGFAAQTLLNPLTSLLYLGNFLASLRSRRITWRGIDYEMISPAETIIHHRASARTSHDPGSSTARQSRSGVRSSHYKI